ncbi:MAG: hypothetical protein GY863_02770 [bacterium]|nr:hypothetical protein [bacterium]
MDREDALLSLERFTTSKINRFDDLEGLSTFGFRGEALASIASVSILEIRTKTPEDNEGILLRAEGGENISIKEIPWHRGTSITVNSLFYNTPARRKFQKNAVSETRQIYRVFRYFSLAYPELYFSLYNGERLIWKLTPGNLKKRVEELFDNKSISESLIEVDYVDPLYKLKGFISIPDFTRNTRNDQYLFLNKRYIKNRTADHGIYQGYSSTLSHGPGHPFYILFLEMPADRFDINIHPTKLEARFHDDRSLHHCFSDAVKKALGSPLPETRSEDAGAGNGQGLSQKLEFDISRFNIQDRDQQLDFPTSEKTIKKEPDSAERRNDPVGDRVSMSRHAVDSDKVWQVHQCFIFAQVKSGLIIIDQHTAHERILYEKALKMLYEGEKPSQQLLFPLTVTLTKDSMLVLNEILSFLEKLGFQIKIFGEDTAVIEAAPLEIKGGREEVVLNKMLEEYQNNEYKDLDIHDRVARTFACRSAIMKGDRLSTEEMYKLIDDLFATDFPFYCPHGRPTVIDMSLKELNEKFIR